MAATLDEAEAMTLLRQMKSEAALLIWRWPTSVVCGLSCRQHGRAHRIGYDTAVVSSAVHFLLADAVRAKQILVRDKKNPQSGSGYIVLAMGKMGAFELNYSE